MSVFSPKVGKYRPEKFKIRTSFMQCPPALFYYRQSKVFTISPDVFITNFECIELINSVKTFALIIYKPASLFIMQIDLLASI